MGPRPFDRGNWAAPGNLERPSLASMGPRPFDRGNWKETFPADAEKSASMGPRPFDRGNALERMKKALLEKLQWGRDHSIAETESSQVLIQFPDGLQWGRDHSIAETRYDNTNGEKKRCFNGAATIRSRKHPIREESGLSADASMGPRPFDRGNCGIR